MSRNFRVEPLAELDGAFLVTRNVFEDLRGSFAELSRDDIIPGVTFVQSNHSKSSRAVLRGMHIQKHNPQGKLVTCIYGSIFDVGIDLRPDSPTFLKTITIELEDPRHSIYFPPGVAHGFLALSHVAMVNYACTTYHDPDSDGGVNWKSPELGGAFKMLGEIAPIVSIKDQGLPSVASYLRLTPTGPALEASL